MKIICKKCNHIIDRDKIIEGQIIEEYKNIYGTRCPKCNTLNMPFSKSVWEKERKAQMELLRGQAKEMFRERLRRK